MAIHPIIRGLLAASILSVVSLAQTGTPQTPPAAPCPAPNQPPSQSTDQTARPCPPPAAARKPSVAEQFPFPGQPAKPAAPPDSPGSTTSPSDAAAQHPFPTQPPPKLPGDDSSSSSSSSGDDPNNSSAKDDDSSENRAPHRKLPKVKKVQTDDERVDEDLAVAKFYLRDENYQGAYLRAKDAVSVQPEYSAAHFALAEVAEKMKKKDEAIAEYQTYLKLDPEGEKAKAAKKALAELQ
jgi:hypothetical protein